MHEIISLQLGQRANYLLTHFWNIQVGVDFFWRGTGLIPIRSRTLHIAKGRSRRSIMMFIFAQASALMGQKRLLPEP